MAEPLGWPAIIGMVGGLVGMLGGIASFGDRFYKGRPVGSLTTQNSFGNPLVQVRIKNITNYDVMITYANERKGVYFLADGPEVQSIVRGQLGKEAFKSFMLKPNEEKELRVQAKYKDGVPVEALGKKYVEFWIHWRRGKRAVAATNSFVSLWRHSNDPPHRWGRMMNEAFEVCPDLTAREICLVVRQYRQGGFFRAFHQHIPKHRISDDAINYLLPALVMKFENNEPFTIVRSFLNKRGSDPSAHAFKWHVEYPEPGVLRKYCGTDTCVWVDQVVSRSKFRITATGNKCR